MSNTVITGTGSYIPPVKIENSHFLDNEFYNQEKKRIEKNNEDIIDKFQEITCIKERRYLTDEMVTSDMCFEAAKLALEGMDREDLDYILVAHNFGDVRAGGVRVDICPSLASRVKHLLGIENPYTVAFDVPFGCPGWLHCMIMADYYIKSGDAKKILVIGSDALSRVIDPHDIDCMIFADGAGAVVVEAEDDKEKGILTHVTRSDTKNEMGLIWNDLSYSPLKTDDTLYLKMQGHNVYKYALRYVPEVVKMSLDKAGLQLEDVKKILIHQANEKMDQAIIKNLFKLYKIKDIPEHIMPMTISWLGNSSVATLPTMFDLLQKGKIDNHALHSGDVAVFASVGAGMNINAMVYRMP